MDREEKQALALLGSAHFLVDLVCTALLGALAGRLPYRQVLLCAIAYNGLAFAFQLPIGILADIRKQSRGLAGLGCFLVAAAVFFSSPVAICLLAGLGNACFHVGGGREALGRGRGKASFVGRFVAPGAIGIFFGPKLGTYSRFLPLVLLIPGVLLLLWRKRYRQAPVMIAPNLPGKHLAAAVLCMFLTVLLRSYTGTVLRFPLFSAFGWGLGFTLCIFFGKYFGGVLAHRFGVLRFSTAAQLGAGVLLGLSAVWPVLALPGIFLFNTSMAVTVTALYRCAPNLPGTMFGLTTFALFLGVLPRLLGWENVLFSWWGLLALGLVSALLLLAGLMCSKGGDRRDTVLADVPGADTAP